MRVARLDLSRFTVSGRFSFSPAGKYLVDLKPEFPFRLSYYDFSLPYAAIPNYHDHLEIAYVHSGAGTFSIAGRSYPAREGDVFVIGSGVFHLLEAAPPAPPKTVTLYFLPELVYRPGCNDTDVEYLLLFLNYQKGLPPRVPVDAATSRQVLHWIEQIAEELEGQESFYQLAVKNSLCQILLILNRAAGLEGSLATTRRLRLRDINRLQPVFDLIHESYARKIGLEELSKASSMSVTHLCRNFKKVTGQTVMEYVNRFRVDRAKELLIEDERSITWIASEVGFESHSYFDRIFHEITRLTPHDFRRKFAPRASVPGS